MNVLKILFDFYINSSIHVALSVCSFTRITEIYFDISYQENLSYFIFFATVSGYNFIKYAGVAKWYHIRLTKNLKSIQIFSFISFVWMCFYGCFLPIRILLFILPLGILTILYAIPFLSGFQKSLRGIRHLKIMVIAFVWASMTVLLPLYHENDTIEGNRSNIILYTIQRFLILVVLTLPFDIRDMKYDQLSLQTIPQKTGIAQAKRIGLALLLFAISIEFIIAPDSTVKNIFMLFFFSATVVLMRATENQPTYYSSFWVEAIPIFWWLSLWGIHTIRLE
ncbi:MAG: hypothetical protein GKR88_16765 [Flavobacteriaceae bacterium]|nr:MAG: hypothetical protein GKR88_16765 [Flavobacteriaceae bacterium]